MKMSDDTFKTGKEKIIPFDSVGKDTFNELLYVNKFLRKVKLRMSDKQCFVWDGKAWSERKECQPESMALAILPDAFKTAKNARSVLDQAMMRQQLA